MNHNPKNQFQPGHAGFKGRLTHGLCRTPTYKSFHNAKRRCEYPKDVRFADYGARGIQFKFTSVEQLVAEIGLRPEGKTIDRIDTNGHYESGNVQWATKSEQAKNRRNDGAASALHIRWHVNRGIKKAGCPFC